MSVEPTESLQTLISVAEDERTLTRGEFEGILADLETRKKYSVRPYNMFCTSEDVVVVCDMNTEEFMQIEVPMGDAAEDEVIVTRDS